jgi:hypothetical protein
MNYSFKARRLGWAVLGALLVGLAHQAAAQVGTSSILGYVYDSTGAAIPRAQVTLTRPSTGLRLTTKTNQTGLYKFPDLLPGTYDLTITHSGFQTYQVRGIVLQVDQHPQYNATLQVGAVTQAVTVRGGVQMLETNTASAGQVIPERTVVSLPLNGRNFLQLATLGAGTTPPVLQGSNASFATNITGTPNSTVNLGGNRESATSYLLDGIPARDERTGALVFQISVDSIQEFKEMRNFFPAEYGFHPAIVNVSTKSGTNEIHGDAWEFLRNDSLDARNFFPRPSSRFIRISLELPSADPSARTSCSFSETMRAFGRDSRRSRPVSIPILSNLAEICPHLAFSEISLFIIL